SESLGQTRRTREDIGGQMRSGLSIENPLLEINENRRGVFCVEAEYVSHVQLVPTSAPTYESVGGHEQMRFLSPYALSTRATAGQNLKSWLQGAGNAARSLVYGCVQVVAVTRPTVCGEFLRTLSCLSATPVSISLISSRIEIIASQNLSSSSFGSLSVGSIMSVPGTGNETVGA